MAGAGNKEAEGGSSGNGLAVGLVSGIGGGRLDFGLLRKRGAAPGLPGLAPERPQMPARIGSRTATPGAQS